MTYSALIAELEDEILRKIAVVEKAKLFASSEGRAIALVEANIETLRTRVRGLARIQAKHSLA